MSKKRSPQLPRLTADTARCFGFNCQGKDTCLRYQTREDELRHLNFMTGGDIQNGRCAQFIQGEKPKPKTETKKEAA